MLLDFFLYISTVGFWLLVFIAVIRVVFLEEAPRRGVDDKMKTGENIVIVKRRKI